MLLEFLFGVAVLFGGFKLIDWLWDYLPTTKWWKRIADWNSKRPL